MHRADLKSDRISAWRSLLPEDIRTHVPLEMGTATDESLDALADDLAAVSARRIPEVILRHSATLAEAGRPRRIRVLAWAIPRVWPNGAELTRVLTESGDAEGGEDGGRSKVAPLFRSDIEAIAGVAMARIIRAAAHRGTVDAVAGGVREFDMSYNMLHGGSF